jgi:hypothetical protein
MRSCFSTEQVRGRGSKFKHIVSYCHNFVAAGQFGDVPGWVEVWGAQSYWIGLKLNSPSSLSMRHSSPLTSSVER